MPKVIDTDNLFRTTVQLFANLGYEATTTQEIARRAGVNEATLFRRYGSKAKLIAAALTHCLADSPFADLRTSDDARADLIAIVAAYQKTVQAYGGAVTTLIIEMPRHNELQSASKAFLPNFQNAAAIIETHQDKGRLRAGNPIRMLSVLIAPIMVSGMWSRSGVNMNIAEFDPKQIVDGFLSGYQLS